MALDILFAGAVEGIAMRADATQRGTNPNMSTRKAIRRVPAHLSAPRQPVLCRSSAVIQGGTDDVAVQDHAALLSLLHQLAQVVHCSTPPAESQWKRPQGHAYRRGSHCLKRYLGVHIHAQQGFDLGKATLYGATHLTVSWDVLLPCTALWQPVR